MRTLLSLIACFTLIAFVMGCGSQNEHLSKGKELIKSNKREKEAKATREFKEAVDIEPDNAEAHYLLGYYASEMEVEIEIGAQDKQPGLKVEDNGVIVSEVQSYSPADRAGMRVGDIIYKVGSLEIHNEEDYQRAVKASLDAGKVTLQLAESKGTETILRSVDVSVQNADEDFGLKITDNGVIVSKVQENSLAASEYIEVGESIQAVDGREIKDSTDYQQAVEETMNKSWTVQMKLKAPVEKRGEHMYLAYKHDHKKYLEILVYETLRDREPEIQEAALNALKRIYMSDDKKAQKDVLKSLMDAIKSKDSRDRYDAGWVLAELGKRDSDTIVPKLIDLFEHKRMGTRLNAVLALGKIKDKRAVEHLVKLIMSGSEEDEDKREDVEVRRLAVEALSKMGSSVVDELVAILENRGSAMRVDAIEVLTQIGDEHAVPSLLKVLGEQGSRQVEVRF